jgi:metallo-beta-lactamase family protein
VHGELDSKKDFADLIKGRFGYDPVVITENSEFELETGKLLSKEEVIRDAIDEDDILDMKEKMSEVEINIKNVLENAKNVLNSEVSAEKLKQINNILLELEKASLNLGSEATAEDRSTRPLSEEGNR